MPARRRWRKRAVIVGAMAAVLAVLGSVPFADYLARLSIDVLIPLRHLAYGPIFPPEDSDVAVVVIDEETYRTSPFTDTPRVAWTSFLATVLAAIDGAGPRVIGLDHIYPTSLDREGLLRGFDRPLLRAIYKAGRSGRLVLGKARLSQQEILPYKGQIRAVGGPKNVRSLNLLLDPDEVVRRYPAAFRTEDGGEPVPSFGVELAARAGAAPPSGDFLINFNTGPGDVPTFAFVDIWRCAAAGRSDYFERAFRDKVVLIGLALDIEDRHVSAKRFAMEPSGDRRPARCTEAPPTGQFGEIIYRRSMPGVLIHAAAINTITKGLYLAPVAGVARLILLWIGIAVLGAMFFALPPIWGAIVGGATTAIELGVSVVAFENGIVVPMTTLALAGFVSFTLIYAYRFVVEDRAKRKIKNAFRHYLAPALVEQLAEDPSALERGGERKHVTVFFSDIAGFTTISESLSDRPEVLVDILNKYLTAFAGAIERHGGYIDKFIGDAVMAVWGAPLDDPEAERHAVEAALACFEALDRFNEEVVAGEYGLAPIGTRVGINTGEAIVGNMGSASRLNYTVTGDMVNLSARLEAANKTFGSRIMVGEETAKGLGRMFLLRRLDRLVVKGKTKPVKVFEVVGRSDDVDDEQREAVCRFHEALALYYRRRFEEARDAFAALRDRDPAATVYVERCELFMVSPPPVRWDRSFVMKTK